MIQLHVKKYKLKLLLCNTNTQQHSCQHYGYTTLPWWGRVLLARKLKGLGPGGGAAACIRRPLPVGVTVGHRNVDRVLKDRPGTEEEEEQQFHHDLFKSEHTDL